VTEIGRKLELADTQVFSLLHCQILMRQLRPRWRQVAPSLVIPKSKVLKPK